MLFIDNEDYVDIVEVCVGCREKIVLVRLCCIFNVFISKFMIIFGVEFI